MRADYHIHTDFSDDSRYPMEQVVQDAIARGLDELCFTDHVDYGIKQDWSEITDLSAVPLNNGKLNLNVDYDRYFPSIQAMRETYGDRITLKTGLEFGMQTHTVAQFQTLFDRYPFDFVLLSVHQVEDKEFWNQTFQQGRTQKEYNERYYEEILALTTLYHDYSVLSHLDSIVRYDKQGAYPFPQIKDIVAEIFRNSIADGKGIELNTSFHRFGLSDSTPCRDILKLYHDMGGEILTIGSDSHAPEHLGAYWDEGRDLLKSLGFRYFCTFENMKPSFHNL